jgi:hypothetical protein
MILSASKVEIAILPSSIALLEDDFASSQLELQLVKICLDLTCHSLFLAEYLGLFS